MKKIFTIFTIAITAMIMASCSCNRTQDIQNDTAGALGAMEQVDTVLQADTVAPTDTVTPADTVTE